MNYGASALMAAKFWTRNPDGDTAGPLLSWVRAVCPLQRGSLLRLLAVWWHQPRTLPIAILILSPWWLPHKGSGVWLRSVCRDGISQLSHHLPGPGSVLLADISVVCVRRWHL